MAGRGPLFAHDWWRVRCEICESCFARGWDSRPVRRSFLQIAQGHKVHLPSIRKRYLQNAEAAEIKYETIEFASYVDFFFETLHCNTKGTGEKRLKSSYADFCLSMGRIVFTRQDLSCHDIGEESDDTDDPAWASNRQPRTRWPLCWLCQRFVRPIDAINFADPAPARWTFPGSSSLWRSTKVRTLLWGGTGISESLLTVEQCKPFCNYYV